MKITPLKSAQLADASYIPDESGLCDRIRELLGENVEIRTIHIDEIDGEMAIIKIDSDTTVMIFAGTESWKDLLLDLKFLPTEYRFGGEIHSGFSEICDAMVDPLRNEMYDHDQELFIPEGSEIICIGHSLGAQTALVSADIINSIFNGLYDISVITFGCPNGWTKEARTLYEQRIKIVTHYDNLLDYVTILLDFTTDIPHGDKKTHVFGGFGHKMSKYIKAMKKL